MRLLVRLPQRGERPHDRGRPVLPVFFKVTL